MSTIAVTTITTANGTTNQVVSTGNSAGPSITLGAATPSMTFNSNSSTTAMFIANNGNIGIAQSAPISKLVISQANGFPSSSARFTGNTTSRGQIHITSATNGANSTSTFQYGLTYAAPGGDTQAAILFSENGSDGTAIGFFDTNSYAAGPQLRMQIDPVGRVTMPNQPMFWGQHNAIVSYAANQLIQITSAYDPNSMFSGASNYRVTVPVAGRYLISADLLLNTGSTGPLSVVIRKNGVSQRRFYSSNGYLYQSAGCSIILSLAANDYIDLMAWEACTIWGDTSTVGIGNFTVSLLG